jgi:hypothetical protein
VVEATRTESVLPGTSRLVECVMRTFGYGSFLPPESGPGRATFAIEFSPPLGPDAAADQGR